MSYGKFRGPGPYKIVVLYSGYHLQQECARALKELGHQVMLAHVVPDNLATTLQNLLMALVQFKPDCLLTINHIGFDDGQHVGDLLERCGVPVACWYCDSPFFVLRGGAVPAPTMTSLFVWERTLIPTLKRMGVQTLSYLPLACDPKAFGESKSLPTTNPVAFVGDSMRHACTLWHERLGHAEQNLAKQFGHMLQSRTRQPITDEALMMQQQAPDSQVWDALGAATFTATCQYRDTVLAAAPAGALHIFGDTGWRDVAPKGSTLHGQVPYGPKLAAVYQSATVNINATSLQMPTAVNQRVFDVPMAGGFLLSDAQADLNELLDPNTESISYSSAAELTDLIAFYRTRPTQRQAIKQAAQKRIMAQHTYAHRMRTLMTHMQQRHQ